MRISFVSPKFVVNIRELGIFCCILLIKKYIYQIQYEWNYISWYQIEGYGKKIETVNFGSSTVLAIKYFYFNSFSNSWYVWIEQKL